MPVNEAIALPRSPELGRGQSNPMDRKGTVTESSIVLGEYKEPAVYYFSELPSPADIDDAVTMGFSAIGLAAAFVDSDDLPRICRMAASAGLAVICDIDITRPDFAPDLVHEHPDWFVADAYGPRIFYLATNDAALDFWDEKIGAMQAMGVNAFLCLSAGAVPGPIWARLIDAAKLRQGFTKFIAWTPGAEPAAIEGLRGAAFDFSISSSCWWDFRASWLDEDAARISRLAPAMTLTIPFEAPWPETMHARLRAVQFAALYGNGWIMPAGFQRAGTFDQTKQIAALNYMRDNANEAANPQIVSSAGADIMILRRFNFALLANASAFTVAKSTVSSIFQALGLTRVKYHNEDGPLIDDVVLAPAETRLCEVDVATPITVSKYIPVDCEAPRIGIESITPKVDDGQFPVRRVIGETAIVEADIIADGHDKLAAEVLWRTRDDAEWQKAPMVLIGNDRWRGEFPLDRLGRYVFSIAAWKDSYATFVDEVTKKHNAGVATHLELEEGMMLLREVAASDTGGQNEFIQTIVKTLETSTDDNRRSALMSNRVIGAMRSGDLKKFRVQSDEILLDAERLGARFASWYEIFPRSQSGSEDRHGTFRDVITQLPRIAAMGFDVLYFPPIHPIGRINRKGKNNTLTPDLNDPGSPYAIGSADGGHNAIHPELGTLSDFHALRHAARQKGIELALDFAIQCAPDHPWLTEHKDWFDWRPDGSLRYAENPPKKYEDIVNVDFYATGAKPDLWIALRDSVQFWVDQGVRLFRVDNPHTKPLPFWEWMIADIKSRHPDAIFLAEAFTRPKVMYRLAKIGFSQSYTYFTWRNTKAELVNYMTELNTTAAKEFFTPHFFVNTPDINPVFLHNSGRPGFLIRAALAATLSGLWGVYNGFELCEATPVAPGKEEYLNSEKYEIRVWDYDRPGNIVNEVTKLNHIRRTNAALHTHLGFQVHNASNDMVLYFSKTGFDGNMVLVAISLDPFNTQEANIEVPLWQFGLTDDASIATEDLMRDFKFNWRGKNQTVVLHPDQPFCIWRLSLVVAE